jgi:hypothetical protein
MDWKTRSLHFELVNKIAPKYKAFPTSTLDSEYDYAREDIVRTSQHMQKLKREGDIGGNQGSKHFKPLFVGEKTFIQVAKKGDAFFMYVIIAPDPRMQQLDIHIQY